MNDRRAGLCWLALALALAGVLAATRPVGRRVAVAGAPTALLSLDPASVVRLEFGRGASNRTCFARGPDGAWRLKAPYAAAVDSAAVARLVDAFAYRDPEDALTEGDLAALNRRLEDFGVGEGALSLVFSDGRREETLSLGGASPSGSSLYARLGRNGTVCTVPSNLWCVVSENPDAYRSRAFVESAADDVTEIDFRSPGKSFVRLARADGSWRLVRPSPAPADATVVEDVLSRLVSARASAFVYPANGEAPDAAPAEGKESVSQARLAAYGLTEDAGLSVVLRTRGGRNERIVFGKDGSETGTVHALVRDGSEVVLAPKSLRDLCLGGETALRDIRAFPMAPAAVRAISLARGAAEVFAFSFGSNGQVRLESPVVAPADPVVAAELRAKILALTQDDLAERGASDALVVTVEARSGEPGGPVGTPTAMVRADRLPPFSSFSDLRSKTVFSCSPAEITRVVMANAAGGETVIERENGIWRLVGPAADGGRARKIDAAAVDRLLKALSRVSAASVESVDVSPEVRARCGLDKPSAAITVYADSDVSAVRKWMHIGGAAPGGGRYVMAGGADAVFVLSRTSVADLLIRPVEE